MTSLSSEQSKALDQLVDWYEGLNVSLIHCNGASDCPNYPHTHGVGPAPVKSLGGLAGTGKTTLMRVLDESVKGEAVFGTPTHKAAGVLRKKLAGGQSERVRTMHSLIYEMTPTYRCTVSNRFVSTINNKCTCKKGEEDGCECPQSFLPCGTGGKHDCHVAMELKADRRKYLAGHRDIVIIDESSMLSDEHVEDLRMFGVPIILVGDRGQLPPIKAPMNRWTMNPAVELTEIHRQGADSGILQAAHDVRANGRLMRSSYGSPKPDAVCVPRSSALVNDLMGRFTPGEDGALLTYTNRLRALLNSVYHDKMVGTAGVSPGDRVVSLGGLPYEADLVEMNGESFRLLGRMTRIHNGMTGTVRFAKQRSIMTEMAVELDDHPLAKPGSPVVIYTGAVPSAQFGAEKELPFNSPMRPKGSRLWDYAYALTAHKAQGSEFPKVIVADQRPREYRQWMYTAITRAQEGVVVVDWQA